MRGMKEGKGSSQRGEEGGDRPNASEEPTAIFPPILSPRARSLPGAAASSLPGRPVSHESAVPLIARRSYTGYAAGKRERPGVLS